MVFDDALDIAAIASGAALAVVFVTCLAFSAWICYRMHQEEGGYFTNLKERWRKKRLRKKLDAHFKKSSRMYCKKLAKEGGLKAYSEDDYACAVCLEGYIGDPCQVMVALLPQCKHHFHFECLWTWMDAHCTCPICRKDITFSTDDLMAVCFASILQNSPQIPGEPCSDQFFSDSTFHSEDSHPRASPQNPQNPQGSNRSLVALNPIICKANAKSEEEGHTRVFHTRSSSAHMETLPVVE